jgi:hypothetical protein
MPSMTTEERLASCFQRIQELETSRQTILDCQRLQNETLNKEDASEYERSLARNIIRLGAAELVILDSQRRELQRLAETFQRALDAFPDEQQ